MGRAEKMFYWGDAAVEPTIQRCLRDYTHVRLHHFCRPESFDSYKADGIRVFSRVEIADQFHKRFSDVDEEHRIKAVKAVLNGILPPRVDAALDDRFMIAHATHYARYGSETILGLTNYLPKGPNYRQRLISGGRPAVIIFNAPIDELEISAVEELNMYLRRLAEGRYEEFDGPNYLIDFTASFFTTVPSEWITEYRWLDLA